MTARKEIWVAVGMLVFGVALLPGLIYLVGLVVFGPYEGPDGVTSIYDSILAALFEPAWATWLLVLSPYLVVQLVRAAFALRRPGKDVK